MAPAFLMSGPVGLIRLSAAAVALTFVLSAGEAAAADASSEQGPQHKATSSESFVAIDPIYSTIIDGQKPRGLLMVEIGLDVPDAKFRQTVNTALPVLRDAYVRMLVGYASATVRTYRQPNIDDIATRLQSVTNTVMGKTGATVLMQQTAIRLTR